MFRALVPIDLIDVYLIQNDARHMHALGYSPIRSTARGKMWEELPPTFSRVRYFSALLFCSGNIATVCVTVTPDRAIIRAGGVGMPPTVQINKNMSGRSRLGNVPFGFELWRASRYFIMAKQMHPKKPGSPKISPKHIGRKGAYICNFIGHRLLHHLERVLALAALVRAPVRWIAPWNRLQPSINTPRGGGQGGFPLPRKEETTVRLVATR
jgi:hypothetical protein